MENKIWYNFPNEQNYSVIEGLLWIQPHTFCSLENTVQASIDAFNEEVYWTEMWTMDVANERLERGHDLFIGVDTEGPLAHVWFENNYLYNLFVNPRRPDGYAEQFIKSCLNYIPYDTISLYTDEWNIRAQKLFEKVGFKKI